MSRRNEKEVTLSAARLRQILRYDAETGEFFWLEQAVRQRKLIGTRAGTTIGNGYRVIRLKRVSFYEHRLAVLYMTGEWPDHQVDHIDGDPANNRWSNLRQSDQTENLRNTRRPSHNTSGVKGVSWCRRRRMWRAYIVVARKQTSLGYHSTRDEAAAAYARGAAEIFREFARVA